MSSQPDEPVAPEPERPADPSEEPTGPQPDPERPVEPAPVTDEPVPDAERPVPDDPNVS